MKSLENVLNIVLIALDGKFCKNISSALAERLDMFWADCKDLIVYNLIDPKKVLKTCGLEYYKKQERKVIENCCEYRNTVISINFELFKEYNQFFKNSLIVYVGLNQKNVNSTVSHIAYDSRDEFLRLNCDHYIELNKKSKMMAVKKIIDFLGGLE